MSPRASVLAILLLLAGTAPAQITPAQATQQLKQAAAVRLAQHKAELAVALAALEVDVDAFDASVASGDPPAGALATLFFDLQAFQELVLESTMYGMPLGEISSILADLANGVGLGGEYPPGFLLGDGGVLDKHREGLVKATDKAIGKARKRLKKSFKKLLATRDYAVNFVLLPPGPPAPIRYSESIASVFTGTPTTIDLVLAGSSTLQSGEGRMFASGSLGTDLGDDSLDLVVSGPEGSASEQVDKSETYRWAHAVDGGGNVVEGAYTLRADISGTDHFGVALDIGVP